MTEGVIWKQLVIFSIPLLIGNLFQQLYNTVDSIVVGQFIGSEALAAVGIQHASYQPDYWNVHGNCCRIRRYYFPVLRGKERGQDGGGRFIRP